jgi:DNA processing protein
MERRTPSPVDAAGFDWLALACLDPFAPQRLLTLVERFGTPAGVLGASAAELLAAGATQADVDGLPGARLAARAEAATLAAAGAAFVPFDAPSYPARLRTLADPPLGLALRGTLVPADEVAVAVVGARRASEYGRRMAEELARGLAQAGVTVVSGLAAGIDAAAHRGALGAGGRTIALLGTGVDVVYPRWHTGLAAEIAARGALLTELPCGTPPLAHHFPRRNRLISGMTLGTVVVEAAEQSGSLITARCALEQGREVFAVPGPAHLASHRGPHRLIQQGAKLVTTAEEVLEEVAPMLGARLATARVEAALVGLDPLERRVLAAVDVQGRHVDEVIRRADVAAGAALETLLALELRGVVRQLPGKRFCRRAA